MSDNWQIDVVLSYGAVTSIPMKDAETALAEQARVQEFVGLQYSNDPEKQRFTIEGTIGVLTFESEKVMAVSAVDVDVVIAQRVANRKAESDAMMAAGLTVANPALATAPTAPKTKAKKPAVKKPPVAKRKARR